MKILTYILCLSLATSLLSCGDNDDANDTEDPIVIDPDPIPTKITTYTADVKPIIDAKCNECHSDPPTRSAPMSLVTYADVVEAEENRDLYGRVFTSSFTRVMPPPEEGGRLPDATVLIIEDWIADGMLED